MPNTLNMLEAAFGAGGTVTVYTSQRNEVAQRLAAGELHLQPWVRTAAYDLSDRGSRVAHKRGYLWMAREYERRMGRRLRAAPVWVTFDLDKVLKMRQPEWFPRRRATERVLALTVPRSELLLSDYAGWSNFVLEGICLDDDRSRRDIIPGARCACVGKRRRTSWEGIFTLGDDPLKWQGVIDRVEPLWVACVVD